jgi:hypothetical protein
MKELCITPFHIGQFDIDSAFDSVFGNDMLRNIHGDNLQASDWKNNKRVLKFSIDVGNIPAALKSVFIGSPLRITTSQKLTVGVGAGVGAGVGGRRVIDSHMKPHFLFSELFKVTSQFYLEEMEDGVYFGGKVEHSARLPPPLNSIAESFMVQRSEEEIEKYKQMILNL